ncbi:uncharacterized protein LOC109704122 isoform X1 [Ananas comosus]|uniref:Uncharacterized protein LOC109704122 isoform X1 n=1 Tax=Ananas comosus TaxID=4615 RepID=A0A6P5EBC5_ANACO|nr:uncharacterized protein LOC109704122 isoform X1 [Ananas comosus]
MAGGRVQVISSRGCSRLFVGASVPSLCSLSSADMMSSASSSVPLLESTGPFSGLVICVTGLSKEARDQVKTATEKLGGQYSASLHPKCTHLVVQSFGGRKLEHALKHGARNGLLVITLAWLVDSVRRNVRLNESLYSVKNIGENGFPLGEFNRLVGLPGSEKSCLPVMAFEDHKFSNTARQHQLESTRKELKTAGSVFSNDSIYIDSDISGELKEKLVDAASREGAKMLEHWFIGCQANYVVCEGPSIQKYIGHSNNVVTPLWILKTVKEKSLQRLVHFSSDLARQVAMILENVSVSREETNGGSVCPVASNSKKSLPTCKGIKESLEERQKITDLAKLGVRNRRCHRMQTCQIPIHPITPSSLLDTICWSISEPTSSACVYTDSSWSEDVNEQQTISSFDVRGDATDAELSSENFSRPLKESEKREVIFKNHFLTILFPVDRFSELGPLSRTFFSNGGFTRMQVLDYIYSFYQENMLENEIEVAIHTDSRHADRLRSLYASEESVERGYISFKRIDFMGSRRSFEALKRLSGETNCNVYELLIRA